MKVPPMPADKEPAIQRINQEFSAFLFSSAIFAHHYQGTAKAGPNDGKHAANSKQNQSIRIHLDEQLQSPLSKSIIPFLGAAWQSSDLISDARESPFIEIGEVIIPYANDGVTHCLYCLNNRLQEQLFRGQIASGLGLFQLLFFSSLFLVHTSLANQDDSQ